MGTLGGGHSENRGAHKEGKQLKKQGIGAG